jgi:hypothetical protein
VVQQQIDRLLATMRFEKQALNIKACVKHHSPSKDQVRDVVGIAPRVDERKTFATDRE